MPRIDVSQTVGRITPKSYFAGPEFSGCSNSGRRPVIRGVGFGGDRRLKLIVVGAELDVREAFKTNDGCRWLVGGPRPKWHRDQGVKVWRFKTRGPALRKFQELVDEVTDFNDAVRAERDAALAKLRNAKDHGAYSEAVLALSDL